VRERANRVWKDLSKPIFLANNLYLDINPRTITIVQPSISGTVLTTEIGITAAPEVRTKAGDSVAPLPLPEIARTPSGNPSFRLHMPVRLEYSVINRNLRRSLGLDSGGIRYPKKGPFFLRFDTIQLSGRGDRMLIRLHFRGWTGGNMYMSGIPQYDTATGILSLKDLVYEMKTARFLVQGFVWISREKLRQDIRKRLRLRINEKMESVRARLVKAMNSEYGGLRVKGSVDHLALTSIESDGGAGDLIVRVAAEGRLWVEID
jgi:hypothetical protein